MAHGWSGAHCSARSRATSRPWSRAAATKSSKSSMVPSSGWIGVVAALVAADRPRRPTSPGAAVTRVVAALAVHLADRMDRRQVHHVEAHRARPGAAPSLAVAKVPCTGLPSASHPPVDRGNISYHELNRASGRSTHTPYCSPRVTSSRSGILPQQLIDLRCQRRAGPGRTGRRARAVARRPRAAGSASVAGTPVAARSNSRAPTNRSLDSSLSLWPASSLAVTPLRQVLNRVAPAVDPERPQADGVGGELAVEHVGFGALAIGRCCRFNFGEPPTTASMGTGSTSEVLTPAGGSASRG